MLNTLMKKGVISPASLVTSTLAVLAQFDLPLGEIPWICVPCDNSCYGALVNIITALN